MAINGVACSGETCVAYGGYRDSITQTTGWLSMSADGGRSFDEPNDVADPVWSASCYGSTCTALTHEDRLGLGVKDRFLHGGLLGAWKAYEPDFLSSTDLRGTDVACSSGTVCVAVGTGWDPIMRVDFGGLRGTFSKSCTLLPRSGCWSAYKSVDCVGSTCVAVSWNAYGDRWTGARLLVSRTSGKTWATRARYSSVILADVACLTSKICVAVGGNGRIVRSTDYGTTWQAISSPIRSYLDEVSCLPVGRCLAVGEDGAVLYSGNSGATWSKRALFTMA
jgi:hypothetical protein